MSNIEKADSNERLSQKLYQEGEFLDWSCIAAFYSAVHLVYPKILPNKYNGVLCKDIEHAKICLKAGNKHEATSIMVRIMFPIIATNYDYLKNLSYTARYQTLPVDIHTAKMCQKMLSKIKKEVLK